MPYNVYQDGDLIAEAIEEKEYIVEGLAPNTEYSFSVSEVIGENESDQSDTVTVTTNYSDVESVAVSPKTNNLEVGATRQLNVTVTPSTARQDVLYSSSDNEIATVDTNGLVTAISIGQVTITVIAENATDTSTVNVTEPDPDPEPGEGD